MGQNNIESGIKLFTSRTFLIFALLYFLLIVAQFLYPTDRMLPFANVDGVNVGFWQKDDAINFLDDKYAKQKINVYIGSNKQPSISVLPSELGRTDSNKSRIKNHSYPWYVRLVPFSILWHEAISSYLPVTSINNQAKIKDFLATHVGEDCNFKAKNADIVPRKDRLVVVPSQLGGKCTMQDVLSEFAKIDASLDAQNIRIPVQPVEPKISSDKARALASSINQNIKDGISIKAEDVTVKFSTKDILDWIIVKNKGKKLSVAVSPNKTKKALDDTLGKKIARAPGVTKITTRDFAEIKRVNGRRGRKLDTVNTTKQLNDLIRGGSGNTIHAKVVTVNPRTQWHQIYTKTSVGLSALMSNFAKEHNGVYGVQMVELGGKGRHAAYNSARQFTTASTYKLFVAYSTLKKVEAKKFKWNDKINGKTLSACFDDMIVISDNACAEALIRKITKKKLDADIRALGIYNTTFQAWSNAGGRSTNVTTAKDLASFLTKLETGTLPISGSSRSKLINAMKRNVYRSGIPSGSSARVANKVGFLWGLLHDAAIVYNSKSTYVLVIMTDGSSWSNIAELSRKIENLL